MHNKKTITLVGLELADLFQGICQPNLKKKNIAIIDSFKVIPKSITSPNPEPPLVLEVLSKITRKNQLNFKRS